MGADATQVFEAGFSIGRSDKSDWVLPDPERVISGKHVSILPRGGDYYLIDESTNGTLVGGIELGKGQQVELKEGDEIDIGEYRIIVDRIESVTSMGPLPAPPSESPAEAQIPSVSPPLVGEDALDPLNLIGGDDAAPAPVAPKLPPAQPDDLPVANQAFVPPKIVPDPDPPAMAAGEIPDDWFNTAENPQVDEAAGLASPDPSPSPRPSPTPGPTSMPGATASPPIVPPVPPIPPVAPSATAGGDVAALLRAAGIDPETVDAGVLDSLGQSLRIVVQGMVEVLRGRAEIKNQFRVQQTQLKAKDNNPLKVAINAEDALFNLFVKPGDGFKDPVGAFREGFDDIKHHQVAMLMGMQAGFQALLARFDPDRLEPIFDRRMKSGRLLGAMNKTKYWDQYRDMFNDLGDDEEAFRKLFGETFAQEYENEMVRLSQASRRSSE